MMRNRRNRRPRGPFRDLRPPKAPTDLRERTLSQAAAAARAAAQSSEPLARGRSSRPPVTDLLWESRPLRVAWALALAALLGVNLYLDREPHRPPEGRAAAATSSTGSETAPAEAPPRTLIASRGEVLELFLGEEPGPRSEPPPSERPRRKS